MNKQLLFATLMVVMPSMTQAAAASAAAVQGGDAAVSMNWEDQTATPEAPPAELAPTSQLAATAPAPAESEAPTPTPVPVPVPVPDNDPPAVPPVSVPAAMPVPSAAAAAPTPAVRAATPVSTIDAPLPEHPPFAAVKADAQLQSRPTPDGADAEPLPTGLVVHLVSQVSNTYGIWWFVTATGIGGGWLPETDLGPITR